MTRLPSERPPPHRGLAARRRVLAGAGALALVVTTILGVGAVPLPVGGGGLAPPACASPAAAGSIRVAVAVDPGGVAGMAGGPETICVTVAEGATGAEVLAARARALGRPVPRYNSAGLLCAIDGQPASGCGERIDGTYRYWAYFLGTGGWTYAGTGPALRRASAAQLEGWRYVAGAGNAADPPPRTSASPAALCPPEPPPPVTPAPAPPNPPPGGSPLAPLSDGAAGSGAGQPGAAGAGSAGGGAAPTDPAGGVPPADSGAPGNGGAEGTDPTGSGLGGAGRADGAADVADSGSGDGRGGGETATPVADVSSPGGPPIGVAVAVALVVALSVGAVVQVRRRGAS